MSRYYIVTAPTTPGASPTQQATADTLTGARTLAKRFAAGRPDLRGQDVRIERPDGALVEYAGPAR